MRSTRYARVLQSTLFAVAAAALTLGPATASESDWSRFRGPNGAGVAEGQSLPSRLDESTRVWRTEVPRGSSSPVFFGDQIFLTALDGEDLVTLCLSKDDGRELWRRKAPRTRREKLDSRNHPAASSPVTDGERVIVFFGDYGVLAYDLSGRELWKKELGPFDNVYGTGASPILAGDHVILAVDQQTDSFLMALDVTSGEVAWRKERPEAKSGHSTPITYRPDGGPDQLLLPGSFYLTSYDVKTGEKLWWVEGLSFEMKSTPVVSDGLLFIHGYGSPLNEPGTVHELEDFGIVMKTADKNGDGRLQQDESPDDLTRDWFGFVNLDGDDDLDEAEWNYFRSALRSRNSMIAIRLPEAGARGDLTSDHVAWQYYRNVPQLPSPLVYRGILYMINDRGIVTTFEPTSGEVKKRSRLEGAVDSFYASPVAGDGKIYFASRSGSIAIVPADGSLEPSSVAEFDAQIDATPALYGGRVYVRAGSEFSAFAAPSPDAQP